jgi:hypothetical protein
MRRLIIFSIVVIAALTSCTKVIEIDLNDEENQRLIVDAIYSTFPQEHEVKLSLSANYYSTDQPTPVSGASVMISDGVNNVTFLDAGNGLYKSPANAAAIANRDYTLTINYDGKEYTGANYCDTVPNLDTVVLVPNYIDGSTTEIDDYTIRFSTQELVGFGDYYAWKIYVNGVLRTDTITELLSQSDEFLPDGTYLFQVELTDIDNVQSGDTIMIAQNAISEETYDAYFAILFQTEFRGGIFDSPPSNVPSNMSEGALGIFSVGGESRNFAIVP